MRSKSLDNNRKTFLVWAVVVVGASLRMLASLRGYNYDVESFRIVADIVSSSGNVYVETHRYNYSPIWFHILHYLDVIPFFNADGMEFFRIKIALFLTIVDLGLFIFLLKRYSLWVAALFFLNPISIIITGYHSQFDNIAILLALISVEGCGEKSNRFLRVACLTGIGLSLCVKHILFVFPLWLAFKEKSWSRKLLLLLTPYCIFAFSFISYIPDGYSGIVKNVFLYRAFNNAPLWSAILPNVIFSSTPTILLFVGAMVLIGYYLRKRSSLESLHIYLISLVAFSSAISNQALAIPVPSIAVFWNWGYALYTSVGGLYLIVEKNGLHVAVMQHLVRWDDRWNNLWINGFMKSYVFELLAFLLVAGLFITLADHKKIKKIWGSFGRRY